jgi:RNA polymerase sigma-70 factor (ECF subfamily)
MGTRIATADVTGSGASRVYHDVGMTDSDLVRRAVAGDARSFEVLVDRHYARCLRFAWRQIGSRTDAEEAVQDAFLRAHRALPGCAPERFGGWLTSILVNRCRTYVARNRRRPMLENLDVDRQPAVSPREPAETLEGSRVGRALAKLSPKLREALLLRHVEQLGYEEIAAMVGAGVSAVKMRVQRATVRLAELMEDADA